MNIYLAHWLKAKNVDNSFVNNYFLNSMFWISSNLKIKEEMFSCLVASEREKSLGNEVVHQGVWDINNCTFHLFCCRVIFGDLGNKHKV